MDKRTGMIEVNLGDDIVWLKGNWKCVQMLEQRLGKGIVQFAVNDLQNLNIGVGTIGNIYYCGMRGNSDTRLSFDEICQRIIDDGVMNHMQPAVEFVSAITSAGSQDAVDVDDEKKS